MSEGADSPCRQDLVRIHSKGKHRERNFYRANRPGHAVRRSHSCVSLVEKNGREREPAHEEKKASQSGTSFFIHFWFIHRRFQFTAKILRVNGVRHGNGSAMQGVPAVPRYLAGRRMSWELVSDRRLLQTPEWFNNNLCMGHNPKTISERCLRLDEELELRSTEAEALGAAFEDPIATKCSEISGELELELELQAQ